jgi:1,5-anhydro-D-fructose reductase (1,5-anhydro-D-mannitol-forming)
MVLNWLVVGIGDIAVKRVIPAILAEPRSRLAGIVTRDPGNAERYGVPGWRNVGAALAACDAQAVYIATPVFLHAEQTIAALRAGRHVLCEKPMALDYAQALTMQQAADAAARKLGVAYYRRNYPKVERARDLLAGGAIGRPVFAEATSHDWFYPAGAAREWLLDPAKAGGGPLYDIACHRIDLMNFLFGRAVQATGYRSTLVHAAAVEDNATVLTEHESGVRAVVDVRWHSRVARDEFRIRGTEGEMDLSPLNSASLVHPGGREEVAAPANLHYPCVEDFASAVLGGGAPRSTGETALVTEWVMGQVAAVPSGSKPR